MENKGDLIVYKKENWFQSIKRKIINLFKRKAKQIDNENTNINNNEQSKEQFFSIYEKAKNKEIDLTTLDKATLYKIMKMLQEEIQICDKQIDEKLTKINTSIYNIKMYQKEIELMKKEA